MNLLEKSRWNYEFPWGSIINPDTGREICISEKLVTFDRDGSVHFGCSNTPSRGWQTGANGRPVEVESLWSVGAAISKDEYRTHFGSYDFSFRLPNFRGSWPAIWLIDLIPGPPNGNGMGIPPETDIFEHFRKDGFLTRFHISHSFHKGPTYANNTILSKKYWKFLPLDLKNIELTFNWTEDGMTWIVNGRRILAISAETPNYPTRPMNLVLNSGLGLDWKPDAGKFEDFVLYRGEYHP